MTPTGAVGQSWGSRCHPAPTVHSERGRGIITGDPVNLSQSVCRKDFYCDELTARFGHLLNAVTLYALPVLCGVVIHMVGQGQSGM